mmetsp:Transcript_10545/g.33454  ORF Transcript_10545/g.33454 Transcript_10545/m.33454 type:complete len:236 (+) Transcript_10545:507-1214(+)
MTSRRGSARPSRRTWPRSPASPNTASRARRRLPRLTLASPSFSLLARSRQRPASSSACRFDCATRRAPPCCWRPTRTATRARRSRNRRLRRSGRAWRRRPSCGRPRRPSRPRAACSRGRRSRPPPREGQPRAPRRGRRPRERRRRRRRRRSQPGGRRPKRRRRTRPMRQMQCGRRSGRSVSRRVPRPPPRAPSPAPRRPSPVAREGRHRAPLRQPTLRAALRRPPVASGACGSSA